MEQPGYVRILKTSGINHVDDNHVNYYIFFRTCFSLQLDGTTLDNFAELKTVEGLKEGSLIKVINSICIPESF